MKATFVRKRNMGAHTVGSAKVLRSCYRIPSGRRNAIRSCSRNSEASAKDSRSCYRNAQVSLEFIFIVGMVILIVVLISPFILKQVELNKALSAARDGAVYGASLRGMGFKDSTTDWAPEAVVKVESLTYTINSTGGVGNLGRVDIHIHVRGPAYLTPDAVGGTVRDTIRVQAKRFIAHAMSGTWPNGPATNAESSGSYYTFYTYCSVTDGDWSEL